MASIKIEGLDGILAGLTNFGDAAKNRITRNASRAGANAMRKILKEAAPRGDDQSTASARYGRLHKNIKIEQLKGKSYLPYYRVTTGDAFWGGFLDKGTKHIQPNYWFRNAVEQHRPEIVKSMVDNIKKSIIREAGKLNER